MIKYVYHLGPAVLTLPGVMKLSCDYDGSYRLDLGTGKGQVKLLPAGDHVLMATYGAPHEYPSLVPLMCGIEVWGRMFPKEPRRKLGMYRLPDRSAEGTLDLSKDCGTTVYQCDVTWAKNIEAANKFYEHMRLGDLEPYLRFDLAWVDQEPGLRERQLEAENAQLKGILEMYRRMEARRLVGVRR